MFTAIIENEGNTLVMEFPCKRYLMADHLGSIGIRKPAHEIKCMDEEEEPIKVKIVGNNEFEKRLALLISPTDALSLVNTMCEFYQNLPYQNRLDAMEAVMSGKGIGKVDTTIREDAVPTPQKRERTMTDFKPKQGKIRKSGTGGIYQISENLWEGRFTPTNAQGKREAHNVYAKTREECERLLDEMIVEVRQQIQAEKEQMKGMSL